MSIEENTGAEEEQQENTVSPKKLQKTWLDEMEAADKRVKSWLKQATKINSRYLAEKQDSNVSGVMGGDRSINLFYSNVSTLESMLYGSLPSVDVSRRYADAKDDIGRVAAETMQRLLNCNIQDEEEDYDSILRSVCQDRLLSGLGVARVRYEADFSTDELGNEVLASEEAPIDYYHWSDVRWGWARNFSEIPWMAFCNYLTKDEVSERFSEEFAESLTYKERTVASDEADSTGDDDQKSYAKKTEIWEIWDKKTRMVHFFNREADAMLESEEDPLGLSKFFPAPPFLIANTTTSLYMPRPDFMLSQELYNDIDVLQTRITKLTEAVKAAGVYDAADDGIKRLMNEGVDNTLIPVERWAAFAEKGGISGSIQWMPLQDIVNALDKLVQQRDANIGLLQQVSGMADVMRGSLNNQYEGVGQSKQKEKYGSVRVQALHTQYATFVSKLLRLKSEVIARHFSPQTILAKSNMEFSNDADLVPQAVELIKQPDKSKLQIAIKPESLAMVDFGRLQEERTGFIQSTAAFMQSAAPLVEADPTMMPAVLTMLQWTLAGFKGAQQIEGVLDKAIEQANKAAEEAKANPQPSPEEMAAKQATERETMKHKNAMQLMQAKTQAENQKRQVDLQADIQTTQEQSRSKIAEIQADMQANIRELTKKAELDVLVEEHQAKANIAQTEAQSGAEITKNAAESAAKIQELGVKSHLDIKAAIAKENAKPAPQPKAEKEDGTDDV